MLEWRELSGREGSAMLSEWQGEDRAEEEETAPSCSVEVEPIVVEQPAVTVEEREAIDDIEFFLGKQENFVKGTPNIWLQKLLLVEHDA